MFIDASVIVAILAGEANRLQLAAELDRDENRMSSPVALFEAVLGLSKTLGGSQRALQAVEDFVDKLDVIIAPVEQALLPRLVETHLRYGKGSGYPAQLNMGDCFSYAMAKRAGVKLLYKGDDFARTDLG